MSHEDATFLWMNADIDVKVIAIESYVDLKNQESPRQPTIFTTEVIIDRFNPTIVNVGLEEHSIDKFDRRVGLLEPTEAENVSFLNVGQLEKFPNLEYFQLQHAYRPYEDPSVPYIGVNERQYPYMQINLVMTDKVVNYERHAYTFLQLLSDFGGFNDGIYFLISVFMAYYSA